MPHKAQLMTSKLYKNVHYHNYYITKISKCTFNYIIDEINISTLSDIKSIPYT